MYKKLIYVADDEVNICSIIKSFLIKEGFAVEAFFEGRSLLKACGVRMPDMVVIDIMLPDVDGFSICSQIRGRSPVPIIFVTARDTEGDKIKGLSMGGDDYLTKPFSLMELSARIKSIFRRISLDLDSSETGNEAEPLKICDIIIDMDAKQVKCGSRMLNLTAMEFSLLYYLAANQNRAVSRSELLDKIWNFENQVETRATDDMIKRIRKKLSEAGSNLKIDTVWGFGFRINGRESA
jgi:DNA-binding response OmpR family regulator